MSRPAASSQLVTRRSGPRDSDARSAILLMVEGARTLAHPGDSGEEPDLDAPLAVARGHLQPRSNKPLRRRWPQGSPYRRSGFFGLPATAATERQSGEPQAKQAERGRLRDG